jgi:hypothetical protein
MKGLVAAQCMKPTRNNEKLPRTPVELWLLQNKDTHNSVIERAAQNPLVEASITSRVPSAQLACLI